MATTTQTVGKNTTFKSISLPSGWTKTGHTFAGWTVNSAGTGTVYGANSDIPNGFSANTSLYAKWNPNSYTITWDVNGGTAPSNWTTNTSSVQYNSNISAPTYSPTRTGYDFAGWYTTASGGSKLTTTTCTGAVTYYAHWTAKSYSISYSNAYTNPNTKTSYTYGESFTPANPTRSGWVFTGWNPSSITSTTTGNVTFTANWTEDWTTLVDNQSATMESDKAVANLTCVESVRSGSSPTRVLPSAFTSTKLRVTFGSKSGDTYIALALANSTKAEHFKLADTGSTSPRTIDISTINDRLGNAWTINIYNGQLQATSNNGSTSFTPSEIYFVIGRMSIGGASSVTGCTIQVQKA